jgi:hypothetical protein
MYDQEMSRPRRILLTGTDGTGRRTIGGLLATEHGFRHVSLVGPGAAARERQLHRSLLASGASSADIVVTWTGGCPPTRTRDDLRSVGFEWFWLDGDRGAAGPPAGEARFVDPFETDGSFRPIASVVGELLAPEAPARRRQPRTTSLT